MSNSTRCAACKYLRRKCSDCVLAPYFPSNNPQKFKVVHKIFGASNVSKMLEQVPVNFRADAAECMAFEANLRIQDPVYGSIGIITQLRQQIIETQQEIERTQAEIVLRNAIQQQRQMQQQQLLQLQEQQIINQNQSQLAQLSSLNAIQEDEFHLDEPHPLF